MYAVCKRNSTLIWRKTVEYKCLKTKRSEKYFDLKMCMLVYLKTSHLVGYTGLLVML